MRKRLWRILFLLCTIQTFLARVDSQSEARDLTKVLARGFFFEAPGGGISTASGTIASVADFSKAGSALAPTFAAAVSQSVTQEFPLVSVSPAFIYRLNPGIDAYERLTGVSGPLFSERALTLGEGKLNLGIGYSFFDYSDINGVALDKLGNPGLIAEFFPTEEQVPLGPPTSEGELLFPLAISLSQIRTHIDLSAHVVIPTLRYGVTDQWDISLSVPIVSTYLQVRNEAVRIVDVGTVRTVGPQGVRFLDPAGNPIDLNVPDEELSRRLFQFIKSRRRPALLSRASGSATGLGDIVLRSKYQFWQTGFGGAAVGLNLQLPTGEARNFHGTEQTHLSSFLYISRVIGERFEPHLNIGVDLNVDDVDRSSFLYAVGGVLQIGKQLGLVVDFLGRSEFARFRVDTRLSDKIGVGVLDRTPETCRAEQPCHVSGGRTFSAIPINIRRNDTVNFSFGLRYGLGNQGSLYFGGTIPLNEDGFRADFIPSGGIEYTF